MMSIVLQTKDNKPIYLWSNSKFWWFSDTVNREDKFQLGRMKGKSFDEWEKYIGGHTLKRLIHLAGTRKMLIKKAKT